MSYLPLIFALLVCLPLAEVNTLRGRVVGVSDGDSRNKSAAKRSYQ